MYKYNIYNIAFYFDDYEKFQEFSQRINKGGINEIKKKFKRLYRIDILSEFATVLLYSKINDSYFNIECEGIHLCRVEIESLLNFIVCSKDKLKDIIEELK